MSTTYEEMRNASCTSCQIQQDMSNYWIPQLYYQNSGNGSFEDVSTIGGMTVYYLQRGSNVTAFPPGFRMLAGTPTLRSYSDVMEQAAINFVCLDYDAGSSSSTGLPTKNCPQGLRAQIVFPSCWNGHDLDSTNHKSHMAYPDELSDGTCPEGFPVRLVTIFYEVTFIVDDFSSRWYSDRAQPFVFAMGDPTGYGLHGDMVNGWDETFLQSAIDTCTNASGLEQDCDLFDLEYSQDCHITPQVDEIVLGTLKTLPGCNPVQFGPGPATVQSCPGAQVPTVWSTTYQYEGDTAPPQSHFLADQAQTLMNYSGWEYLGCFSDQALSRTLPVSDGTPGNITVETCLDFCSQNAYPYGGMESGDECWCGTVAPASNDASLLTYEHCATVCNGDNLELCGGDWALSIYNNTAVQAPSIPEKSTDLTASYVGCYIDSANRIMTSTSLATNATVDGCVHACQSSGNTFSAVEYGGQCYCSSTAPASTLKTIDSQCNMQCTGERTELCGGSYRLQVYQGTPVSASMAIQSMPYAGCYTDSITSRSLAYQVSTSGTVENCLQTCSAAGYTIAGLEYGSQCWCDQVVSTSMTRAAETECNTPCTGNAAEICGGSNRLSLYNSTALIQPTLQATVGDWLYDGCWTDDASRVMTAATSTNSTVNGCISECQLLGYSQSAVEYGGQCFCGTLAARSVRVADSGCNLQCGADPYHLCGGSYRLQLYKNSPTVTSVPVSTSSTVAGFAGRVAIVIKSSAQATTTSRAPLAIKPAVPTSSATSSPATRAALQPAKVSTTSSHTSLTSTNAVSTSASSMSSSHSSTISSPSASSTSTSTSHTKYVLSAASSLSSTTSTYTSTTTTPSSSFHSSSSTISSSSLSSPILTSSSVSAVPVATRAPLGGNTGRKALQAAG